MIKEITLKNFQSHESSSLELSPGVNVIIGTSDCGKTSIIRALKWVAQNKPLGNEFISHWSDETKVEIKTDDFIIERKRTKTKNSYTVKKESNLKELVAFGAEVPEEVRKLLNLSEINFQNQLDSPFLLTNSPGEVAAHFNEIGNLEDIDLSIKNIQKLITQIDNEIRYEETSKKANEEKLKTYDYLEIAEIDIEMLEKMEQDKISLFQAITTVRKSINQYNEIQNEIEEYTTLISSEKLILDILSLFQNLDKQVNELAIFKKRFTDLKIILTKINTQSELIQGEAEIQSLLQTYDKIKELKTQNNTLSTIRKNLLECQKQMVEMTRKLRMKEDEFITTFPEVCPLCNKPKTDLCKD